MFSKFPSFPFSITKCDIGGGGMETCQVKGCSQGGGGATSGGRGGGSGGFRVMVHKSLKFEVR